ncbi:MAG: hypothetical protein ACR2PR_03285 [Pseudohongiellaceae bacterium]
MLNAVVSKIESEDRIETHTTQIKIELTREDEINCPPCPQFGSFGDNWIVLQDNDVTLELGYFEIQPEGIAMQLLRLAWIAAHAEARQR